MPTNHVATEALAALHVVREPPWLLTVTVRSQKITVVCAGSVARQGRRRVVLLAIPAATITKSLVRESAASGATDARFETTSPSALALLVLR